MASNVVELHVVSDSTGETAARLVTALEAQFPDTEFDVVRHPRIETVDDLQLTVNRTKGRPASAFVFGSDDSLDSTNAVVRDNGSYRIDQEKCVKCDACREQAPYAIAVVDEFGLE